MAAVPRRIPLANYKANYKDKAIYKAFYKAVYEVFHLEHSTSTNYITEEETQSEDSFVI